MWLINSNNLMTYYAKTTNKSLFVFFFSVVFCCPPPLIKHLTLDCRGTCWAVGPFGVAMISSGTGHLKTEISKDAKTENETVD